MKTLKSILIVLTIAFVSSTTLTGCFVDEDEVFEQVESGTSTDTSKEETNSEEWGG